MSRINRGRIVALMALFSLATSFSTAYPPKAADKSWSGYLIDLACARERKDMEPDLGRTHTKKCMEMPACDRSGFGLLTDANELLPFDENGNSKVRALLQQTSQTGHLRVIIHGTKANDVLQIRKIELKKS